MVPRTKVTTEEVRSLWQSQQTVLKPSTNTPSPGISPQVPVRLPGTCGGILPAAASPAHVLSGALQGEHEPSVTGVGTPGQGAPRCHGAGGGTTVLG